MTVMVYRGIGHPWTAAPGWDQLYVGADDRPALEAMIADAEQKLWRVWHTSWATLKCHLFKPQEAKPGWQDVSWQGTPRGHGHQFKVGDEVYTDFNKGKISKHKIVAIEPRKISQTGVMLRVTPAVHGSGYMDEHGTMQKGLPWIDSAWFRKMP